MSTAGPGCVIRISLTPLDLRASAARDPMPAQITTSHPAIEATMAPWSWPAPECAPLSHSPGAPECWPAFGLVSWLRIRPSSMEKTRNAALRPKCAATDTPSSVGIAILIKSFHFHVGRFPATAAPHGRPPPNRHTWTAQAGRRDGSSAGAASSRNLGTSTNVAQAWARSSPDGVVRVASVRSNRFLRSLIQPRIR